MSWLLAACLGAFGGFLVSAITLGTDLRAWRAALRAYQRQNLPNPSPRLAHYVTPKADLLVLMVRVFFGAVAGALFYNQIVAAVGVGAAAPALLAQFRNDSTLDPEHGPADTGEPPPWPGSKGRHRKSDSLVPPPRPGRETTTVQEHE